jgi:hypothetical protein
MPYIHGDEYYYCDTCGRKLKVNPFSSVPMYDIKLNGWEYRVEEVTNVVPSKLIYSQYTGGRWVREHTKTRSVIRIKCDICVLVGERVKKIKQIKEKIYGQ